MRGIPSPLTGEGEALHRVGCRTKALNLIWFRGGGDLGDYFTASGGLRVDFRRIHPYRNIPF